MGAARATAAAASGQRWGHRPRRALRRRRRHRGGAWRGCGRGGQQTETGLGGNRPSWAKESYDDGRCRWEDLTTDVRRHFIRHTLAVLPLAQGGSCLWWCQLLPITRVLRHGDCVLCSVLPHGNCAPRCPACPSPTNNERTNDCQLMVELDSSLTL
ncbi:uncharacterized protein LY79DRAFT_547429 [Colletotrichum navitas]|uniref:Uncharacterized protein n=1 Tax=Colletotrichum navitas TaxID=681940 RepID=A0AAD8Q623_9PEZI|nr:uncharacterized protein LY79DRAFT_547429 [Colletotrichum navitas]KAK1595334.1 hypothetical protein LY79DRAFT_547429 [Colletotrichum navitas]